MLYVSICYVMCINHKSPKWLKLCITKWHSQLYNKVFHKITVSHDFKCILNQGVLIVSDCVIDITMSSGIKEEPESEQEVSAKYLLLYL